ncbi:hypothetical protein JRI60_02335 [Archangium violaceum]|uniref:hypothetical protein n=1 Tax=Archangium violaceum TaxID=83451 RepID=UPI00194F1596|nr:hypothetical protein [Archangium violaceum]QRN97940.1 hypothetical protein JRI60_02335 [Archangium violaceum]
MRHALPLLMLLLLVACPRSRQPEPRDSGEPPSHTAPEGELPPDERTEQRSADVSEETGGTGDTAESQGGTSGKKTPRRAAKKANGATDASPEFPWPPPAPSTSTVIPGNLLPSPTPESTLGQVADHLSKALQAQGYVEMAWFRVPQGFALVTQLEHIREDGTPVPPPDRWGDRLKPARIRSLRDYLRGLFVAPEGRFRLIVFLVTSATVSLGEPAEREKAMAWLSSGSLVLDRTTGAQPYTSNHKAQVLIYEFEKPSTSAQANLVKPSALTALEHLKAAGITNALQGAP